MRMFWERFNWAGKTHSECVPWVGPNGIKENTNGIRIHLSLLHPWAHNMTSHLMFCYCTFPAMLKQYLQTGSQNKLFISCFFANTPSQWWETRLTQRVRLPHLELLCDLGSWRRLSPLQSFPVMGGCCLSAPLMTSPVLPAFFWKIFFPFLLSLVPSLPYYYSCPASVLMAYFLNFLFFFKLKYSFIISPFPFPSCNPSYVAFLLNSWSVFI